MAHSDAEHIRRAQEAKQIIEHPLFDESFAYLRRHIIEEWIACAPTAHEAQHKLHSLIWATDQIKGFFLDILNTGTLTQDKLAFLKEQADHSRLLYERSPERNT